eukprot:11199765-Alexandrium_andersonii.AAC.1
MSASLVGSEMCIRDSPTVQGAGRPQPHGTPQRSRGTANAPRRRRAGTVSYTHLTLPTICSV